MGRYILARKYKIQARSIYTYQWKLWRTELFFSCYSFAFELFKFKFQEKNKSADGSANKTSKNTYLSKQKAKLMEAKIFKEELQENYTEVCYEKDIRIQQVPRFNVIILILAYLY